MEERAGSACLIKEESKCTISDTVFSLYTAALETYFCMYETIPSVFLGPEYSLACPCLMTFKVG